ncbi:hypothetical protein PG996_000343 [Apiospora saccharicola]|uniref:Uncharacterized protein n=1 Tax=Apiospora saccharicola TaxID=335842 RepID=A0ABR1WEX4_9PEZI
MAPMISFLAQGTAALTRRDSDSPETMNLLVTLLGVAFCAMLLTALLLLLRRMKRQQQAQHQELSGDDGLPQYSDLKIDGQNTRGLTIQTPGGRSSIFVVDHRPMLADPNAPPHSPTNVPQIHITFPDEQDEQGRNKSGRVMMVRVGETTIGMEPIRDEQLPAYEKESKHGFYSIDMDQIGGLKEKDRSQFQ